jgi:hypothetical protein
VTAPPLTSEDDLRHPVATGQRGRDSLYFNLVLPERGLGAFVYTWVDHEGIAGRLVATWTAGEQAQVFDIEHGITMGAADFDDWDIAGLRLRHTDPLRAAELTFASDEIELDYRFEGTHEAFDYRRNPIGSPTWMATNRFEQSGRVTGRLRAHGRDVALDDEPAHRDHSWGRRNWRMPQHWKWVVAETPDGHGLNLFQWVAKGEVGTNGYVLRDGRPVGVTAADCRATYLDDMTSASLRATLLDDEGGTTELQLERFANIEMPVGASTILHEAACAAHIDGVRGGGQFETQWPAGYVRSLVEAEA